MTQHHLMTSLTLTILLMSPPLLAAAVTPSAGPPAAEDIEVVKVTSTRLSRDLFATPAAVSLLDARQELQLQEALQLNEALKFVPGVYFQNRYNFAQNLRISIRGFGSRAPFGVRGLQLQVDDIPYTLPDGQTQVDDIDLNSVEQLQVIRGAAAVQYGNGAGGAIDITTVTGDSLQGVNASLNVGSHDFYKVNLQAGTSENDIDAVISISHLNFAGYREQSQVKKSTLRGKLRWDLSDTKSFMIITSLMDMPEAQDPGGLTAAQVASDRRQATFMASRLNSGQQVAQQTIGLVYHDEDILHGSWSANTFATHRNFTQQLPFPGSSLIRYDRWFYGGSIELSQDWQNAGWPVRYTAGAEIRRQEDDRTRFRVTPDKVVTQQTADELQQATSVGVFAIVDWLLFDTLTLTTGVRYDDLAMSINDRLGLSAVGSGERHYQQWNGNIGISYRPGTQHQWYANVASAYESPTFTEFANPQGSGFNPILKPQDTVSLELGWRGQYNDLSYDVALFSIRVTDELIAYEIDGRAFYENAGKTNRHGLETALQWQLNQHWQWRSALTLARYEFGDFAALSGDNLNGNRMPGLPQIQWVNQLNWQQNAWRVELEGTFSGNYYAENSNTTKIAQYWLVNGRVGYDVTSTLRIQAGVRNLFDKMYFSNVRVNANADREVSSRGYFEPAPGRSFYFGLTAQF